MDTTADAYKVSQLTKQLVALNLQSVQNPCAAAAALVRETIKVACKASPQQAEAIVADACNGGMQALVLAHQDLACGAVMMLSALPSDTGLEPAQLSRAAVSGFARAAAKLATKDQLLGIERQLERRFSGAGQSFSQSVAGERAAAAAA